MAAKVSASREYFVVTRVIPHHTQEYDKVHILKGQSPCRQLPAAGPPLTCLLHAKYQILEAPKMMI